MIFFTFFPSLFLGKKNKKKEKYWQQFVKFSGNFPYAIGR